MVLVSYIVIKYWLAREKYCISCVSKMISCFLFLPWCKLKRTMYLLNLSLFCGVCEFNTFIEFLWSALN